ncbi:MAG TPA: hypothetical protein VK389_02410 [Thermoanaerobaculia bacterium]|nr:hypothetical protein [Thermoanaerobaculia bacterium]
MKSKRPLRVFAALLLASVACNDDDGPTGPERGRLFRVRVGAEEFCVRLTDPQTIELAMENLQGRNSKHPNGSLATGDGGFNAPWSWHFVPDSVRMVDSSIELCDVNPSYVESHRSEYLSSGYCPWSARVIAVE